MINQLRINCLPILVIVGKRAGFGMPYVDRVFLVRFHISTYVRLLFQLKYLVYHQIQI